MEQFLQNASETEHLECSRDLLLFGIDDVVVVVGSRKRKKKISKNKKQKLQKLLGIQTENLSLPLRRFTARAVT